MTTITINKEALISIKNQIEAMLAGTPVTETRGTTIKPMPATVGTQSTSAAQATGVSAANKPLGEKK